MSEKKEIRAVPLIVQGRSFRGETSVIEDVVLFILEAVLKCQASH